MQSVEINILSGENLRVGKNPVKKNSFVTVWADSPDECCATKMSVEGGCSPTWNQMLSLDLQPATMRNGFITLEVHCKTSSGSKVVAGARIPISDFLGGFQPRNHLQLLSYRLRDPTSERNGIINISVRVKSSPEPYRSSLQALQPKAIGVPIREGDKRLHGVVTGVPAAWLGHRRSKY